MAAGTARSFGGGFGRGGEEERRFVGDE